ncbi:MAG: hypothetical protein QM802_16730 [Agriterribacter sp.]
MKAFYTIISALFLTVVFSASAFSQNQWPKTFTTSQGKIVKVYQWQSESYSNGTLQANAAISVLADGKDEPVFGMIWFNADAVTNGQQVDINAVTVNAVKLPNENNEDELAGLQNDIGQAMSGWNLSIPLSDINGSLQSNQEQTKLASAINNNPPKIIYSNKPSLLVVIDGAPKFQTNSKWNVQTVVNTPFIIIKNNSNSFYLYGGKHWYMAPSVTGPYNLTTNVPSNLENIQEDIVQANKDNNAQQEQNDYSISNIIISTEPAELLQSNGEPNFTSIQGTNLLYVKNSDNDIFMDVNSQQYYVLLSGRWYRSSALDGNWQYINADKLPSDFAKIPEGSPKDNVLASVAGTEAADDAVMNAQVPQTAKVDRRNATANIQYDGNPQFDDIDGTDMAYAVNTSGYVIRWRGSYYAVDNGVWFQSYSPMGPWTVSVERPYAVAYIPARYPVYAMKYVYVYDVTPDYVYMGYTPGYLNTFVYGPTVVYGTGYYYRPWYGNYYYARPYTWGFNMHYNPWSGWGFGFNYNFGWFNIGFGNYNYSPWGYYGGWWGPSIYRPSYCWNPYRGGYYAGYYGNYYGRRSNIMINNNINIYRNNNIYNSRRDVVTRDNRRIGSYNTNAPGRGGFANARPIERNGGYNNSRPVAGRNGRDGGFTPTQGTRRVYENNNGTFNQPRINPSRNFNEGTPNRNNRINQQTPGVRSNNNPNDFPVRRQIAEQQTQQPAFNRGASPVIRQDNSRQQQPSFNRQQPVNRSFEPRQAAPQRAERPANINRAPSGGGNGGGGSRPSGGGGEGRGRRG